MHPLGKIQMSHFPDEQILPPTLPTKQNLKFPCLFEVNPSSPRKQIPLLLVEAV